MVNPFTPTFGVTPPLAVGRDDLVFDFEYALDNGVGDPARAILIDGQRGSGKTVALNILEDIARQRNWEVISASVNADLMTTLKDSLLPKLLNNILSQSKSRSITSVSAAILGISGGLSLEVQDKYPFTPTIRDMIEEITRILGEQDRGLLISLDEIHLVDSNFLNELFSAVQHGFRRGDQLALVVAGLPHAIDDILNLEPSTFLRRAFRATATSVTFAEAIRALSEPLEGSGVSFDRDALKKAARESRGYAFLIQAIGYEMYRASKNGEVEVSREMTEAATERAMRRMTSTVYAPIFKQFSALDREFVIAVAKEGGHRVKMAAVNARMGRGASSTSQYRGRLIAMGIISPSAYGEVSFTYPYFTEYVLRMETELSDRWD